MSYFVLYNIVSHALVLENFFVFVISCQFNLYAFANL